MFILTSFAFLAGIATVLSPCILPVLPAILSASAGAKLRPFGVIAGLITSFVFFTLALTSLVQSFALSANVLRYTAIFIIGFFGLVMVLPTFSDLFARATSSLAEWGDQLHLRSKRSSSGFWSGFLLGMALGLVWTPCAGPILAAITTLVATHRLSFDVALLTFAYSLGAGIPLLILAYGGNRALVAFPTLAKYSEAIRRGFGLVMMLTALALAFNWDVAFQQKILDYLPNIQLENNAWVQQQLQQLRSGDKNPWISTSELSTTGVKDTQTLPKIAPAPPLVGIEAWLNSQPLNWEDLKGRVVLIDFWTYSCINCIRTFPYLRRWYDTYKDLGFTIIGVHTPEFEFEKDVDNVKKAVERFQITYPVALDNHYATWESFHNAYWPAHYLIDQEGIVRDFHFGEGGYVETENAIRTLFGQKPLAEKEETKTALLIDMTPETYLGYQRANAYVPQLHIQRDQFFDYPLTQPIGPNQVALKGKWKVGAESALSGSDDSLLMLNFKANRVYLVLKGKGSSPIRIELDGHLLPSDYQTADERAQGELFVKEARKYDVLHLKGQGQRHVLTLHIPKGIEAYAFTFGMEE